MENEIIYSGLKDLTADEQLILKSIVEKECPKIQRLIKNESKLNVRIKVKKKETRKRFSITFKLDAPIKNLGVTTKDTEQGGDWDLAKATHKALDALYFETKHRLRTDVSSWKKGGIKNILTNK